MVANYWQGFSRGMPMQVARRLAVATLNRVMVVPEYTDDGEKMEGKFYDLEWWRFR